MSVIQVHLEVPQFIEAGLVDGSMERVGGVIRHSDNKQIVAWLREGGQLADDLLLKPGLLDDVLRAGGITAKGVGAILGSVFPILDIALAGYLLLEIIGQIDKHRQDMELIYDRLEEEFWQDRLANLVTALKIGRNLSAVKDVSYKRLMAGQVTDRLLEAREHLREESLELLNGEMNDENAEQALRFQILSMQAAILIVRSWLEIGEKDLALKWLGGILRGHRERVRLYVRAQLGNLRALFFHESVSDEYFERYLNVERWLRGKRVVLPEIVQAYRHSFWDGEAIKRLHTGGIGSRLDESPFYETALPRAEILIENYQRLEGFEQELKSMCLPTFAEWEAYDGDGNVSISEHDGYVMLVNAASLDAEGDASP